LQVVYDHESGWWAPLYWYVFDDVRQVWQRTLLYRRNAATGRWERIEELTAQERRITPPPMLVLVDRPFVVPVVRGYYPGFAYGGPMSPGAPCLCH
jgi:hypothetical protein